MSLIPDCGEGLQGDLGQQSVSREPSELLNDSGREVCSDDGFGSRDGNVPMFAKENDSNTVHVNSGAVIVDANIFELAGEGSFHLVYDSGGITLARVDADQAGSTSGACVMTEYLKQETQSGSVSCSVRRARVFPGTNDPVEDHDVGSSCELEESPCVLRLLPFSGRKDSAVHPEVCESFYDELGFKALRVRILWFLARTGLDLIDGLVSE